MSPADPADPAPLLEPWSLGEATAIERLGGSNNASWRVTTPAGSYALRLYRNSGNLPHVEFEHALLDQLARMPLSFKVPAPLVSKDGRTLEPIHVDGEIHRVAVSEIIAGEHPRDWKDLRWVRAAGAALGELDAALAGTPVPAGLAHLPTYGNFDRIHPDVPDPEADVAALPLEGSLKRSFTRFLSSGRSGIAGLYSTLPRQIIHSDFDGSNLLFVGDRVNGILDFEFAAPDLRAMDLAIAVVQIASEPESDGLDLVVVRALAAGYGTATRLTAPEIEAIPALLRLRGAVSVIHRLGRWKSELSPIGAVEGRIRHNLGLDRWLQGHRAEVIEALAASS